MLAAALSALAGGVTALTAILGRGERSLLVFFSLLVSLFVLHFVAGEIIAPH